MWFKLTTRAGLFGRAAPIAEEGCPYQLPVKIARFWVKLNPGYQCEAYHSIWSRRSSADADVCFRCLGLRLLA